MIDKWAWACKGKDRPGDSAGMKGIHVWKRNEDRTATCKKCGETLTEQEANDCFRQW